MQEYRNRLIKSLKNKVDDWLFREKDFGSFAHQGIFNKNIFLSTSYDIFELKDGRGDKKIIACLASFKDDDELVRVFEETYDRANGMASSNTKQENAEKLERLTKQLL